MRQSRNAEHIMRTRFSRLLLTLTAMLAVLSPTGAQDRDDPRVILISIDGPMPSSYTRAGS
jgi:hypothetical protein